VDHVLALLPFEPPYMRAAGMTCDFVGHPVAETKVASPRETVALREELGIGPGRKVLVALPGSRASEVRRLGPVFAEVVARLRAAAPELAVVVPAVESVLDLVERHLGSAAGTEAILLRTKGLSVAEADRRKQTAFAMADAALAASGTVSLELAAQATPMVIAYGANPLTATILRRMVRLDTVTLVNLVTHTRTVPEFLLEDCTAEKIAPAVARILRVPEAAEAQRDAADRTMALLGRGGEPPGVRAARSVLSALASPHA
jgi:lipid-A-disaccharide synthase